MDECKVFFEINSTVVNGRIIFQLFESKAPKTCKNLCINDKGLTYRGSLLDRLVSPEFIVQGGNVGTNIYGGQFEDENLGWCKLNEPGYLCMANNGPNTNLCEFFITLCPTPWLADSCTVFGKVISGIDVLKKLGDVPVDEQDTPVAGHEVIIVQTGRLKRAKKGTREPTTRTMTTTTATTTRGSSRHTTKYPKTRIRDENLDQEGSEGAASDERLPMHRVSGDGSGIIVKGRGRKKFRS